MGNIDVAFSSLTKTDDLSGLSCRNQIFDSYLRDRTGQDMRRRAATVVLLKKHDSEDIIGYYTIGSLGIALTDLPEGQRKRLPRYPVVPTVLVGRLALDHRHEGMGNGQLLLVDALERAARQDVAVRGVVVDAIDENAVEFYEQFGFIRPEIDPGRLILPIETFLSAGGCS